MEGSLFCLANQKDTYAEYNTSKPEFKQWLKSTKLVENSKKSLNWYNKNKSDVKAKHKEYWSEWKKKSPSDIAKRTLSPRDGM